MTTKVQVYEFSRAFDHVHYSSTYNRWVSGGYSPKKIHNDDDVDIPFPITQSVKEGYFSINDSFPPNEGEVVIIAREIPTGRNDNTIYSVLSIANRQIDDGGRPTIGYKYFWTTSHSAEMDGILQLLFSWGKNAKIEFQMQEQKPSQPVNIRSREFINLDLKPKNETQNIISWSRGQRNSSAFLNEIKSISNSIAGQSNKSNSIEINDFMIMHCLALVQSRKSISADYVPCAWGFNISPSKLLHPKSFIYIADENQHLHIGYVESVSIVTYSEKPSGSHIIPSHQEKVIKQLLLEIDKKYNSSVFKHKDLIIPNNFFDYLIEYKNASWNDCVDSIKIKQNATSYQALIYLVKPDTEYGEDWLQDFWDSIEVPRLALFRRKFAHTVSLDFHTQLLDAVFSSPDATSVLQESILFGIVWLLRKQCSVSISNPDKAKLKYLLINSKSAWSEAFYYFTQEVICKLSDNKHKTSSTYVNLFCLDIADRIDCLNKSYNNNLNRSDYVSQRNKTIKEYSQFDYLFKETSGEKLSDLIKGKYPMIDPPSAGLSANNSLQNLTTCNQHLDGIVHTPAYNGYSQESNITIESNPKTSSDITMRLRRVKSFLAHRILFPLSLLLLPTVLMLVAMTFINKINESKSTLPKGDDCENNSIETLIVFKQCMTRSADMITQDIGKQLLSDRKNEDYTSMFYLQSSQNEADYQRKKSKVVKCSQDNTMSFKDCLSK
jgi:hypothetical protein